jgi:hypothetical protein
MIKHHRTLQRSRSLGSFRHGRDSADFRMGVVMGAGLPGEQRDSVWGDKDG